MNPTNTNDEQVRKIMGLDRADRKAAEQAYTTTAFDYETNPVGSQDWCRFWDGWRAALSQPASEPVAPARFWIDCEYNEFRGALISMALVPESGPEFYEVLDCQKPGPWVAEHVMPILNKPPVSLDQFHKRLSDYLNRWQAIHIIADWPEDIAHFCQSLIVGPGERLNTPPLTLEVVRDDAPSDLPHNALEDARGMRRFALSKADPRINEGSGQESVDDDGISQAIWDAVSDDEGQLTSKTLRRSLGRAGMKIVSGGECAVTGCRVCGGSGINHGAQPGPGPGYKSVDCVCKSKSADAAPPAAVGDDYQAVMSNIEDQVAAGRMGAAIVFTKMRELVIAALREMVS